MSIARVGSQVATGKAGSATSVAVSAPANVTAGSLLVVTVVLATQTTNRAPVVGDLTKTAGTCTIGTVAMDVVNTRDLGTNWYLHTAVYSIPITGSGSLTLTLANAPTGSWLNATLSEYSATGGWNATAATRLVGTNTGSGSSTSPATASVTSTGGALFVASLNVDTASTLSITEGGSFTLLDELENPASFQTFSATDRIVSTGTTATPSWTLGASNQWAAVVAAYKEDAPAAENVTVTGTATVTANDTRPADEAGVFRLRGSLGKSGLRRGATLRGASGSTYTETGLAITGVVTTALSDLQRYQDLARAVPAVCVVTAQDVGHLRELGLAVPIAALVAAADAQHYRETGIPIPVTGVVSVSDAIKYKEAGLAVTAVGVVAAADLQHYRDAGLAVSAQGTVTLAEALHARELGLAVTIVGTSTAADVQHYREASLAVPVAAVVAAAAAQHYRETGLALSAAGQVAVAELQQYKDTGLAVTVQAVVSLAVEQVHGTTPLEALAFVAVASTSVADAQHYLEGLLPVAAQAVLAATDRAHYSDALQVVLAATLSATDVQHYVAQLQALAVGQVAIAEAQHWRETGLLAAAMATVTVTDTFRGARWGIPVIKASAAAWRSPVSVAGWSAVRALPWWGSTSAAPWSVVTAAVWPSRVWAN